MDVYKVAAELIKENPGMKSYEALAKAKEIKKAPIAGKQKTGTKKNNY